MNTTREKKARAAKNNMAENRGAGKMGKLSSQAIQSQDVNF